MANDDPRAAARGTQRKDRLTGASQKGLGAAGRSTDRKPDAKRIETRPVLLVGKLSGLTPGALEVGANPDGTGATHLVRTDQVDFRKAKGFGAALEEGIARMGYPIAQGADVISVNSNPELLRAIKSAGTRQVIYFGHAAGPGALWPGGTDAAPVDRASLEKAFSGGGPRPIFIGCNAGGVPVAGAPPPANAVGLDRLLILDELQTRLSSPDVKAVKASDLQVTGIRFKLGEKGYAPQAPLPARQPITPE